MAKKSMNRNWLFLIGAIILVGGIFYTSPQLSISEGLTTLSVDNIDIQSNAEQLNNKDAFLINLVANGAGEQLKTRIDQSTIDNMGLEGVEAGTFTIKVFLEDMKYKYPIHRDTFGAQDSPATLYKVYGVTGSQECIEGYWGENPLYDFATKEDVKKYATGKISSPHDFGKGNAAAIPPIMPRGIESHIPSSDFKDMVELGEWAYWAPEDRYHHSDAGCYRNTRWGSGDWYTTNLWGVPYATGYNIDSSADIWYKVRVVMENEKGDTISTTITPDNKVGTIEDVARVKFVGGLTADKTPQIPAIDYSVIKYTDNVPDTTTEYGAKIKPGMMKVVDKFQYENYKSVLREQLDLDNNYFVFQSTDPGIGASTIIGNWNTLNNEIATMTESGAMPGECQLAGSTISCEGKGANYPELQILLSADWVGLEVLVGEPQIVNVDVPDETYAGDTGIIKATVKNSGKVDSSFDVNLECPSEVSTTNDRMSIKQGEEKTAKLSYSSMKTGVYNCTIHMTSTESPVSANEDVQLTIAQEPLPQEITALQDIPQLVKEQNKQIAQLSKTVGMLVTLIKWLVVAAIGGLAGYGVYRLVRRIS